MGRSQGSSHRARMSSARFSKEDTEMSSVGPGSESPVGLRDRWKNPRFSAKFPAKLGQESLFLFKINIL